MAQVTYMAEAFTTPPGELIQLTLTGDLGCSQHNV